MERGYLMRRVLRRLLWRWEVVAMEMGMVAMGMGDGCYGDLVTVAMVTW